MEPSRLRGFSGNGSGLTGVNSDSGSWVNGTNSNVHLATSTDKVGIGTTEPETIFQIGSKAQTTGVNYLKIRGNNVSASALPDICGIIFNNSDIASLDGLRGESKIINERAGNNYGSALAFYTNPTDAGTGGTGVDSVKRMVIDENGDLRVGGDGMLTINERTNSGFDGTARDETIALQTTIDGRTLAQGAVYGHEPRVALALQPDFGYVGVGTVSPVTKLDVAAQHGDITNPMVHFRANRDSASNGDGNVLKLENSGNRSDAELLQCVSSGNDRFVVRANGELTINGTTMSKAPRVIHIDDNVPGCPPARPVGDIMSYNLVVTRDAYVYVSVTTILNYGARSDCEIYFGSNHIQSHLTAGDNTSWNPVNITAGGGVSAGTTLIRFRSTRANVVGCQGNWGGMQIIVFER